MLTAEEIYAIVIKISGDQPMSRNITDGICEALAKLQPEGMVKLADKMARRLCNLESCTRWETTCCGNKDINCDYKETIDDLIPLLPPYLLQAKEEEFNRIKKKATKYPFAPICAECPANFCINCNTFWQALSSPATEKEERK